MYLSIADFLLKPTRQRVGSSFEAEVAFLNFCSMVSYGTKDERMVRMGDLIKTIGKLIAGICAFIVVVNAHRLDDIVRAVFYPVEYKSPILENLETLKQP